MILDDQFTSSQSNQDDTVKGSLLSEELSMLAEPPRVDANDFLSLSDTELIDLSGSVTNTRFCDSFSLSDLWPLQPRETSSQELQSSSIGLPTMASSSSTTNPSSLQNDLPPQDLIYSLVSLYLENVHPLCPVLHYDTAIAPLVGAASLSERQTVLLHAIVAASLRFCDDGSLGYEQRQRYRIISRRRVLQHCMENSSIDSLKALTILALDIYGECDEPLTSNLAGLMVSSAARLGLNNKLNLPVSSAGFELQPTPSSRLFRGPDCFPVERMRSKLGCMFLCLGAYAGMATGNDLAVDSKQPEECPLGRRDGLWDIHHTVQGTQFTTDSHSRDLFEDSAQEAEEVIPFWYHCEIFHLLAKSFALFRQVSGADLPDSVLALQSHLSELDRLVKSSDLLPPLENCNTPDMDPRWALLRATICLVSIWLHASETILGTLSPLSNPIFITPLGHHQASESLVELSKMVRQKGLLKRFGLPFALILWTAARAMIVRGYHVDRKLWSQVAHLSMVLHDLGQWWPIAARYHHLLQRILERLETFEAGGVAIPLDWIGMLADLQLTEVDIEYQIRERY